MEIIDLRISKAKLNKKYSKFDPYALEKFGLQKIILLPDFYPGRSYLPVGTVSLFNHESHTMTPNFLGRDIGCGMSLFKTDVLSQEFDLQQLVDHLDRLLIKDRNIEFTIGNHFVDFCDDVEGQLYFVIHAGFKRYGMFIVKYGFAGEDYLVKMHESINKAVNNRLLLGVKVFEALNMDNIPPVLDKPHNTAEILKKGILYRKGAVKLVPGELSILPSNLLHPILIVKGKKKISNLEYSFCHGTGREKPLEDISQKMIDYDNLRNIVKMPSKMPIGSLKKLLPTEYKNFLSFYHKFSDYISIEKKLRIIGYVGYKRDNN
ncbi:MAG: RtcB family protein [Candidatus Hodarchaeota archaeon]